MILSYVLQGNEDEATFLKETTAHMRSLTSLRIFFPSMMRVAFEDRLKEDIPKIIATCPLLREEKVTFAIDRYEDSVIPR